MINILVVEDTADFAKIAKEALYIPGATKIRSAATFEDAIAILEQGSIDVVLTDLFYPSTVNWTKELLEELPVLPGCENSEREVGTITENPSGLAMVKWCHEQGTKCIIISQGDHHKENYGKVREFLINKDFITGKWDPLVALKLCWTQTDKSKPEHWLHALVQALAG